MIIADPKEPKDSAPPNTEKEPASKKDYSGLFILAGFVVFVAVVYFLGK